MNGMIAYSSDTTSPFDFETTATFTCNEGFFIEGEPTRSCAGDGSSINGMWNGASPFCAGMCAVRWNCCMEFVVCV